MIHRHSNFLDQDVLEALRKKYETSRGQAVFEVNHMGRWGKGLEAGSYAPVLILPIPEYRDYLIEKYQCGDVIITDSEEYNSYKTYKVYGLKKHMITAVNDFDIFDDIIGVIRIFRLSDIFSCSDKGVGNKNNEDTEKGV